MKLTLHARTGEYKATCKRRTAQPGPPVERGRISCDTHSSVASITRPISALMFETCSPHHAPVTRAHIPLLPDASRKPSFDIRRSPDGRAHTSACLCCGVCHNPKELARVTSSVELHDYPFHKAPTVCRAGARNTQDRMAQSATHPCVDQETDATRTSHSSSEVTLDAFLVAHITIAHHTDVASTGQQYPSTDMPLRLIPRAKAPPGEQLAAREWLISVYSQKATPCGSEDWRGSGKVKEGQQISTE